MKAATPFKLIAAAVVVMSAPTLGTAWADGSTLASAMGSNPSLVQLQEAKSLLLTAEILVLHASNRGEGIDERIGDIPQLKKPPFSAYDTYKLVEKAKVDFSDKNWGQLALPNKSSFGIKLNEVGKKKYEAHVRITKPNGKRFVDAEVRAKKGDRFFLAGPKHEDGILVLGIRMVPRAKAKK